MDVTQELVQQLMKHAAVSEADARAALTATGGDLLDALVWLEQHGKIDLSGVGSSHSRPDAPPPPEYSYSEPPRSPVPVQKQESALQKIWRFLTENRLECRKGERRFEMPLAVLIALLFFAWYAVLLLALIALVLGWRCRFAGPQLGRKDVNDVMDQLDSAADRLRRHIKDKKKH